MTSGKSMIRREYIANKIPAINAEFHVNITADELLADEYSLSSATDFLAARVTEELNGEWSTAIILQKISLHVNNGNPLAEDTLINEIFEPKNRRTSIEALGKKMGYPTERLLRPSRKIYGLSLVMLFLCIPAAIGISWFFSSIAALLLLALLYYLDRNGSEFRSRTLIEFAEEIEWRRNMELRKVNQQVQLDFVKSRLAEILKS